MKIKGGDGDAVQSPAELPRVMKNECVDRFWQAMEAYCRPVTEEDVKFLEEQIHKLEDEEATYFKIPALGRHYRDVWAEEDLLEEKAEGMSAQIILSFISHNSARNGRSRESESARKSLLAWF